MWKLQENVYSKKDLLAFSNYLKKSKRLTQGDKVYEFEKSFSQWNQTKYSLFVNSGSSANLIMIYSAKDIFKWNNQDEIIVPSLTWPTTVTPVMQAGLKPVFVDCNLTDLSFNYEQLKEKINKKTKAIFVTHILGYPANIQIIKSLIKGKNIILLEDCCEALGSKFNNLKVGNFGLAGSFSFYWGHHITTIEGGMIVTNNEKFYNTCILKRSHGFARELPKKYHKKIQEKYKKFDFNFLFLSDGFNLRSTNFNAYIGIHELRKLDKITRIRNDNHKVFLNVISKFYDKLIVPQENANNYISSFAFPFIFKKKKYLIDFIKEIRKNNFEYRPIIAGNLVLQPFLRKLIKEKFKNSNFIQRNGVYLGNNQFLTKQKIFILEKIFNNIFINKKIK
jgi:CDP-6-deoxy-D-xylo-4-hexulose-3-dehydrase